MYKIGYKKQDEVHKNGTKSGTRSKLEKYEEVDSELYMRKYMGIGPCAAYKGSNPWMSDL